MKFLARPLLFGTPSNRLCRIFDTGIFFCFIFLSTTEIEKLAQSFANHRRSPGCNTRDCLPLSPCLLLGFVLFHDFCRSRITGLVRQEREREVIFLLRLPRKTCGISLTALHLYTDELSRFLVKSRHPRSPRPPYYIPRGTRERRREREREWGRERFTPTPRSISRISLKGRKLGNTLDANQASGNV